MTRTIGSDGKKTANHIRTSSLRLFAERGYGAVSMRTIAEAVGVGVSALYNHYPTKQSLLFDLLHTHMVDLLEALRRQAPRSDDPSADLEAFARFHIKYHLKRPDKVFLSYMELRSLEPENFATLTALRSEYEGALSSILYDLGHGEPKVVTRAILGMLTSTTNWYRPEGRLAAKEIEKIFVQLTMACSSVKTEDPCNVQCKHALRSGRGDQCAARNDPSVGAGARPSDRDRD